MPDQILDRYKHIPLARLGRVVKWHEEQATYYTGRLQRHHTKTALRLREIITALFIARFTAGDYA